VQENPLSALSTSACEVATCLAKARPQSLRAEALSESFFPITGDRMTLQTLFELSRFLPLAMALAAVFMAATVSSTVGFAFSAFAAGLLFQIMSDKIAAVEIMLVSSIAVQIYSVSLLRHHIALSRIKWYLLGGILALPIGILSAVCLEHGNLFNLCRRLAGELWRRHIRQRDARHTLDRPPRRRSHGRYWRHNGPACGISRRCRRHVVRHPRIGQADPTLCLPAIYPHHAGRDARRARVA
jgi:hypothetical protein